MTREYARSLQYKDWCCSAPKSPSLPLLVAGRRAATEKARGDLARGEEGEGMPDFGSTALTLPRTKKRTCMLGRTTLSRDWLRSTVGATML